MPKNKYFKMKVNRQDSAYSNEFHDALKKRNNLIETKFGANEIIVAAPHNAPKGENTIAKGKRPADNNTAYVARNIADHCRGQLIVATRANRDPNKLEGTYLKHTIDTSPEIFVEIHGHKGGKKRPFGVEVSCGSKNLSSYSEHLAKKIKNQLKNISSKIKNQEPEIASKLKKLRVSGNYDRITLTGQDSKSIKNARSKGIIAYHIELGPAMRISTQGTEKSIPKLGVYVSQAISAALAKTHKKIICKKSNRLENLVPGILAVGGLVAGLAFLSFNITGNVVSNLSQKNSNIVGVVLFVLGIMASFFYFKGRK